MIRRSRSMVQTLVLMALCHVPSALHAQSGQMLTSGTRVRIAASAVADTLLIGDVAFLNADTLTFAPLARRAQWIKIPVHSIDRLEVSRGRSASGANAALGALFGAGASAFALGSSAGASCYCPGGAALGAIVGGVVGALLGGVIGAGIGGQERWEERPLHFQSSNSEIGWR